MIAKPRTLLLNPGPVTLTPRVRQALLGPDLCHREVEFSELQTEIVGRLERVYPEAKDEFAAVLLTGSGTAAVEAMVGSLVPRSGKALVVANGVYGRRMADMLQAQGKPHVAVDSEFTDPMNLEKVAHRLATERFSHVLAVHHETTTGRLNDLASLGSLCHKHDVPLLLDAVSSFGGEAIDFSAWNVQACASTANKCLHGVPGTAFVLVRRGRLAEGNSAAPCLYLDLFRHHQEQAHGKPLFTPAVHVLYALREALIELDEQGGWAERQRHYAHLSHLVRRGLADIGIRPLLPDASTRSVILTSFGLPPNLGFADLHERLKQKGFIIYPGQSHLARSIFRIAVLGDLTEADMIRLVEEIRFSVESPSQAGVSMSSPAHSPVPTFTVHHERTT